MLESTLDGRTPDLTAENIEKLKQLFPEIVTEGKVDFDKLRLVLGGEVDTDSERYNFTWHGKAQALRLSQTPSAGTLRPCAAESKNWDATGNLYIEGDNLEALKLLQKSYHGKVKMIYIDPPYNTGGDFVYPDDFRDSIENYKKITGQVDGEGRAISTNSEASGRYHTDWLNMMYPRLRLARNLLTDDGVIIISIDDKELLNLRKIADEVFGENNYLGTVIWKNATDNNPTNIATEHEYIAFYSRDKEKGMTVWKSKVSDIKSVLISIGKELTSKFEDDKLLQEAYSSWFRENKAQLWPLDRYKYIDRDGVYTGSQSVHNPGREGYRYDIIHPITRKPCIQPLMGYRFPQETMQHLIEEGKIIFGDDENKIVELKVYAEEYQEKLSSWIELDGRLGSYDLKELFNEQGKIFTNSKPVKLLNYIFSFVVQEDSVILDFFSGSATTAHAVMQLNAEDGGHRKFIMVQLPEPCKEDGEAYNAGYKNICEIGKERIRRAGDKIKEEKGLEAVNLDIGFKVFKLDSSNIRKWRPEAANLERNLEDYVGNYVEGRGELDVVYEIMLKYGIDLACPVVTVDIGGKRVYSVGMGLLMICLANDIGVDVARGIVRLKEELKPENGLRVVFRDNGFSSDSSKTNTKEILKAGGVEEFVTV